MDQIFSFELSTALSCTHLFYEIHIFNAGEQAHFNNGYRSISLRYQHIIKMNIPNGSSICMYLLQMLQMLYLASALLQLEKGQNAHSHNLEIKVSFLDLYPYSSTLMATH